jgi:hypothetical protein
VIDDDSIETQLANVRDMSLALTRKQPLEAERKKLIEQVEHPRFNIGTGPPGRAD